MRRLYRYYPRIILALAILLLALFGGVQFYRAPLVLPVFLGLAVVAVMAALIRCIIQPPGVLAGCAAIYIGAMIITVTNLAILPAAAGRLVLAVTSTAVLILAVRLNARTLFDGLTMAGWLWPGVWLAAGWLGWGDNSNITATWSLVFVAVALAGRNWWFFGLHVFMLFFLTGRGAILGAAVAFLVMTWPTLQARANTKTVTAYSLAGIVALWGLIAWRPLSSMVRLTYWHAASVIFANNILFGIGPGGLGTKTATIRIPEPGNDGSFQIHAHNFIASTAAEMGLVGLAALAGIAWLLYRHRHRLVYYRWQLAALSGLLAHSLVDEPLWWPGPLLAAALIAGSTPCKKSTPYT